MSQFESLFFNFLKVSNQKHEVRVAKYALKLYNKMNGTSFTSKTPKIVILKIDTRKNKKITA